MKSAQEIPKSPKQERLSVSCVTLGPECVNIKFRAKKSRCVIVELLSHHDDEEVEHTHPAQLALDQGHQVLEGTGRTSRVRHQSADQYNANLTTVSLLYFHLVLNVAFLSSQVLYAIYSKLLPVVLWTPCAGLGACP